MKEQDLLRAPKAPKHTERPPSAILQYKTARGWPRAHVVGGLALTATHRDPRLEALIKSHPHLPPQTETRQPETTLTEHPSHWRGVAPSPTLKKEPNHGGGATTIGPDATHPPAICQNLRGGGSWGGGGGVGGRAGEGGVLAAQPGGGAARDPLLPHAYLKGVCVSGGGGGGSHTRTGPSRPPVSPT